jgi:hypothetical protein
MFDFLFTVPVVCQEAQCDDGSLSHLMLVEFNRRQGMPDHFDPQDCVKFPELTHEKTNDEPRDY